MGVNKGMTGPALKVWSMDIDTPQPQAFAVTK